MHKVENSRKSVNRASFGEPSDFKRAERLLASRAISGEPSSQGWRAEQPGLASRAAMIGEPNAVRRRVITIPDALRRSARQETFGSLKPATASSVLHAIGGDGQYRARSTGSIQLELFAFSLINACLRNPRRSVIRRRIRLAGNGRTWCTVNRCSVGIASRRNHGGSAPSAFRTWIRDRDGLDSLGSAAAKARTIPREQAAAGKEATGEESDTGEAGAEHDGNPGREPREFGTLRGVEGGFRSVQWFQS